MVSFDGREEALSVSFSTSVMAVIAAACVRFGRNKKENFSLHLENGKALDEEVSLEQQNVNPMSTLILKKKEKVLPSIPVSPGKPPPPAPPVLGKSSDKKDKGKMALPTPGTSHGGEAKQGTLLVGEVLVSLNSLPVSLSIGKISGKYNEATNIWKEPDGSEFSLPTDTPTSETPIKAGTLNKLVIHLSSADNFGMYFYSLFVLVNRYLCQTRDSCWHFS